MIEDNKLGTAVPSQMIEVTPTESPKGPDPEEPTTRYTGRRLIQGVQDGVTGTNNKIVNGVSSFFSHKNKAET